jgi:hypothetical protein
MMAKDLFKRVSFFILLLISFSSFSPYAYSLDSRFKPEEMSTNTSQSTFKLGLKSEKVKIFARDAGLGLAVGALSGATFVGITQGRLPNGSNHYDTEALSTGMIVGLISGLATGYIQTVWANPDLNQK